MKKIWQKISLRIDSRSLRERAMMFGMAAGLIIFMVFFVFLDPTYARQKRLLEDMSRQQDKIAGVEAEIAATMLAHTLDPDAAERTLLAGVVARSQALSATLTEKQRGMVPPERMTGLLEQILHSHRALHLKSLRTLGEEDGVAAPATGPAAAPAVPAPPQLLHNHRVELVVEGSYADMVAYMAALEALQGQIFWERVALQAETYPKATLTLVVYTVSLDQKWLTL